MCRVTPEVREDCLTEVEDTHFNNVGLWERLSRDKAADRRFRVCQCIEDDFVQACLEMILQAHRHIPDLICPNVDCAFSEITLSVFELLDWHTRIPSFEIE